MKNLQRIPNTVMNTSLLLIKSWCYQICFKRRRINIALDNVITFIIKVCQKYLLASDHYIELLRFSWGFQLRILFTCLLYI